MPTITNNVSKDVAEGVKELLNEQTFSLPFQAERDWDPENTAAELERATVLVVPGQRDRSPLTMGGKFEHLVTIDVTVERALGGQDGEKERKDELADFAQEVEDFLANAANKVAISDGVNATPVSVSIDWDREAMKTERVFRTLVSVNYKLAR